MDRRASPAGKPDFDGHGYYVAGSYVITGESRPYRNGAIGNVRPVHDHGAVEVALRYSEVDLDDGPVRGGKQQDWTLGANWYLGQHLKLQANYVWLRTDRAGASLDPEVFEARVQVAF